MKIYKIVVGIAFVLFGLCVPFIYAYTSFINLSNIAFWFILSILFELVGFMMIGNININ